MRRLSKYLFFCVAVISCKDPYEPPVTTDQVNLLVVDGGIDATDSTAAVKLSRAIKLSSPGPYPAVVDAAVSVEEENGSLILLPHQGEGIYRISKRFFNSEKRYRLRITDSSGKNYSSDYVPLLKTPEIDTIIWQAEPEGLGIYISSKPDANASKYYRWQYVETWQYTSSLSAILEIVNEQVTERPPADQTFTCWTSKNSTDILVKSTELFDQNTVQAFKVAFVPIPSGKLAIRYSILVTQTSLTEEAYNFWEQLKKSTQGTGGLFDPLPSQVLGNISSELDSQEPVLGFFSAYATTRKRLFADNLPSYLRQSLPEIDCPVTQVPFARFSSRDKTLEIVSSYGSPVTLGYTFATLQCVDCRYYGGTNVKPSFWN